MPHAALASACAAIIPLGHGSRHGSSSLPEGCSLRRLAPPRRERVLAVAAVKRQTAQTLTRRAGPALPSYLALHHAGFSVPHALLRERWALTPPFHPYQRIVRRHLAGFPARRHRAVPRRFIFCGTFRERIALCRPKPASRGRSPGVTRRVALAPDDSGRCPDFPPALRLATLSQRSPGSPALGIVARTSQSAVPTLGMGALPPPPPFYSKSVILG